MRRILVIIGMILIMVTFVAGAAAAKCTTAQVKTAVDKMSDVLTKKGKAGFDDVKKYRFCGDNYVWVTDMKFVMLMHPAQPKLIGRNVLMIRDDKRKMFNADALNALKTKPDVWIQYRWLKPGVKGFHDKCGYYRKIKTKDGEMIVSAGLYGMCPR